jgi:hypothetical protein
MTRSIIKTCLSTNRPTTTYVGQAFFETDTKNLIVWSPKGNWFIYEEDGIFQNNFSASLDGTDDYLDLGTSSALNPTSALTVSAWVKADTHDSTPNTYDVIYTSSKDSSGANTGFVLTATQNKWHCFYYSGATWYSVVSDSNLVTGQWYHLASTWDGSTAKLYVNGSVQTSTLSLSSISYSTATSAKIGSYYTGNYLHGLIDEVSLFDSALSASDITAIYNSGVPADLSSLSPVGWWRMGDGTGDTDSGGGAPASGDTIGTVADQGSGGNDATNPNGTLYSNDRPYALPSITNTLAGSFDGTDDYLNIPHSSSITISGDMTICAWVNRTELVNASEGGYLPILSKRPSDHTSTNYQFYCDAADGSSAGGLRFYNGSAAVSPASATVITAGSWFHVAISIESGVTNGTKWYINGVAESNSSTITIDKTNTDAAFIGRLGAGFSYYAKGLIDEVALFNSALSASDITAIYNSGVPADLSSLSPVGWWRLGDGTGDTDSGGGTPASGDTIGTVVDQGSGGNDATNPNGALYSSNIPS